MTKRDEILLEILRVGVLNARFAGWKGDAAKAAHEADHVHNLPIIIRNGDKRDLHYYWDAERPAYQKSADPTFLQMFEPLWGELRQHLEGE